MARPTRVTATISHSFVVGVGATNPSSGTRPPMRKRAADAAAACTGRAARDVGVSEFITQVGPQRVGVMQRLGDLLCQVVGQAAVAVDAGELGEFGLGVGGEFALFFGAVAAFDVDLRAHRNVLSGGHGHRSGGQTRDTRG